MKINAKLPAGLLLAALVSSISVGSWAADAAKKQSTAPKAAMSQGKPWSSLTTWEKSVLSILETQWPKISADHQQEYIKGADNWTKMQPNEQKALKEKMYKELGQKMP